LNKSSKPNGAQISNSPFLKLEEQLKSIIKSNEYLMNLFSIIEENELDCYLAAGCIMQSVWNHLLGFDLHYGVKDIDIVYFELDRTKALDIENCLNEKLPKGKEYDIVNQAFVHEWYEEEFNLKIAPYASCEQAISTWPTTANSLGMKYKNGEFEICAPFGLEDLFNLIVRPNKVMVPQKVFEVKSTQWVSKWPKLRVIEW
jgi:hypothetical protein